MTGKNCFWKEIHLGSYFKLGSGKTKPLSVSSIQDESNPFPIFGGNGVIGFTNQFNATNENIIIGRVGANCGCVHYYIGKCWITDNALYTTKQLIDYDLKFMTNLLTYLGLDKLKAKGGQPLITQKPIHNLLVYIPQRYNEQRKIGIFLNIWDQAIEKTEKLIDVRQKHYKWLSYYLLFGKNYNTSENPVVTKWFNIPKHWQLKKIKEIAREVRNTNGTQKNIPVLSCTKYDGLVDSLKYFDKQIYSINTSSYKIVKRGQFVYATNHIEEGSIGYQDIYSEALVSPMYTVFESKGEINNGYLFKVLKTELYRHIFEVNTSASVDRRGSLRWNQFSNLPIPFPPKKEQDQIDLKLSTARKEIDLLKSLLLKYKTQKRGLMQKLLTGKWRVKINEEEIDE